jgi:4-hydroxy-3-methylbut-2-en-1-yl diphosphate reductase
MHPRQPVACLPRSLAALAAGVRTMMRGGSRQGISGKPGVCHDRDAVVAMNESEQAVCGRERLLLLAPMAVEAAALRWAAPGMTVVRTGVGPECAAAAAAVARRLAGQAVAVAGFCGALSGDLRPGDIVVATEVRGPHHEPHGGSRAEPVDCSWEPLVAALRARSAGRVFAGPVVSADHVVRGAERTALAAGAESGAAGGQSAAALAVDMESAWLAKAAAGRPFAVLRVVLDTPAYELTRPLAMLYAGVKAWRTLRRAAPALAAWAAGASSCDS